MSNPQQPELARNRKTPALDQDAVPAVLEGQPDIGADAPRGPVPPENQAGHHPADEQDKPPLDKFAAKLGTMEPSEREEVLKDEQPAPATAEPAASAQITRTPLLSVAAALGLIVAVLVGRRIRRR